MRRYAVGDVCGEYLADVVHWLTLARDWAAAHEQVAGPEMVLTIIIIISIFFTLRAFLPLHSSEVLTDRCTSWQSYVVDVFILNRVIGLGRLAVSIPSSPI